MPSLTISFIYGLTHYAALCASHTHSIFGLELTLTRKRQKISRKNTAPKTSSETTIIIISNYFLLLFIVSSSLASRTEVLVSNATQKILAIRDAHASDETIYDHFFNTNIVAPRGSTEF